MNVQKNYVAEKLRDIAAEITYHPHRLCTGAYARTHKDVPTQPLSPDAIRWCPVGFLRREGLSTPVDHGLEQFIANAITFDFKGTPRHKISHWNDAKERRPGDIVQVFLYCARLIEEDGWTLDALNNMVA